MNNGPPKSIPESELFLRLSSSKRPFEVVDFPRNDPNTGESMGKVAIVPLTQGELIIAKAEATGYARACIKEKFDAVEHVEGYKQVYDDAAMTEILFRACRRPDNTDVMMFPNAAKLRMMLTSDECSVLLREYAMVQNKLGPIVSTMTAVEYEAWIERLKVGGSALPLAFLSWEEQTALLMYLVDALSSLRTANSSVGKLPDEPTPTESA